MIRSSSTAGCPALPVYVFSQILPSYFLAMAYSPAGYDTLLDILLDVALCLT